MIFEIENRLKKYAPNKHELIDIPATANKCNHYLYFAGSMDTFFRIRMVVKHSNESPLCVSLSMVLKYSSPYYLPFFMFTHFIFTPVSLQEPCWYFNQENKFKYSSNVNKMLIHEHQ